MRRMSTIIDMYGEPHNTLLSRSITVNSKRVICLNVINESNYFCTQYRLYMSLTFVVNNFRTEVGIIFNVAC